MNEHSNHLTDPRFLFITAIFILYGVFIILVLFFAGTPFWNGLWKLCKDFVGLGGRGDEGSDVSGEGDTAHRDGSREGTSYQLLSERSKKRLDTLRQLAIERLLVNYSMKLRQENVVIQRESMTLDMSNSETIINNSPAMISNEGDSTTSSSNTVFTGSDIEEGFCSSSNDTGGKDQTEEAKGDLAECDDLCKKGEIVEDGSDNDEPSYTHVLLPYPGVGLLDGLCIETSQDELTIDESNSSERNDVSTSSDESVQTKRKWPFGWKQHIPRRNEDEARNKNNSNSSSTEMAAIQPENIKTTRHTQRRRQVPIFCSICLSEFNLHQQICWSSNPECTHAFHSDCMVQWLVALGRKRSTTKRFTLNPTERQLLEHYELQCPCCRQEFIKSAFIEKKFCERSNSAVTV